MSGGAFNHKDYHISDIANQIQDLIDRNNSTEQNRWGEPLGRDYSPETIAHFREAVRLLQEAHLYVHRIDWLLSGDDGEDNFLKRIVNDLEKFRKQ